MDESGFIKVYDIRPAVSGFARIASPLPSSKGGSAYKASLVDSFLKTKSIQILEGTISRVYWSGQGDTWPMFEMKTDEGETFNWERKGDEDLYQIGHRVRIHYFVYVFSDEEISKRISQGWNPKFVAKEKIKVVEIHVQRP